MTTYLLDTNILSYFVRGYYPALNEKMAHVFNTKQALTSAIVRAEMRFGQSRMAFDDKRRRAIDLLLNQLPTLPWTSAAADVYGTLKMQLQSAGTPIGELDTQIAVQALTEGLVLVTHNTRHFERVAGLKLEDWMA